MTTTTTFTKTDCLAVELIWDYEGAKLAREALIRAIGRDCFCEPGESCWLMDNALKGLRARQAVSA